MLAVRASTYRTEPGGFIIYSLKILLSTYGTYTAKTLSNKQTLCKYPNFSMQYI